MKQAIINSKTQAFKNHNIFKNEPKKVPDQIARPAEVQADISRDAPPSRDFLPSPEVSPLYTRENEPRDHFHPMNHYYRPVNQDARFPTETPFSANPVLDTRWLGGSRAPNEAIRPPMEFMQPPQLQHGRNTIVDYPFFHVHRNPFQQFHNRHISEEKINFPSGESSASDELKGSPWAHQVPALNFKKTKGSWKWVPDEEIDLKPSSIGSDTEPRLPTFDPPSSTSFESSSPQTSRDRPYSFESQDSNPFSSFFGSHPSSSPLIGSSQHHRLGPSAWPSSGSETLLSAEEYQPTHGGKAGESGKEGNLDIKLTR